MAVLIFVYSQALALSPNLSNTSPTNEEVATVVAIDPVGKTLDLVFPLRVNARLLEDIGVRIQADGEIFLHQATLARLLLPLLKSAGVSMLQSVTPINGFLSLRQLHATGLNIGYDSLHTEIVAQFSAEQALATGISLGRGNDDSTVVEPTPTQGLSGFINLFNFVRTDYNPDTRQLFEYQPGNFRTQSDAALHFGQLSLVGEGDFDDKQGASRSGTRLIYDFLSDQVRTELGDVVTTVAGTQRSVDLLGLSIVRSASTISAGAPFRPTGKQSFHLANPAVVEVYINGAFSRRLNLEAGDFDLQDLDLGTGANDVKLIIEDKAGHRSQLDFGLFIGGEQLASGVNEFGLTGGIASHSAANQLEYAAAEPVMSGFFRYGVTDWLTLGINAQSAFKINRFGNEILASTAYGSFGLDTAYIMRAEQDSISAASGLDFRFRYDLPQHNDKTKDTTRRGFGFSLDRQAQGLSSSATAINNPNETVIVTGNDYRFAASYWQNIAVDYQLNLSVTSSWGATIESTQNEILATLSKQFHNISTTLALGIADDLGTYAQLGINFNLGEGADYRHVAIDYNGRSDQLQLNYSKLGANTIGTSSYQLNETYGKGHNSWDGSVNYNANRFDLKATQSITTDGQWDNVQESRTSLQANTAVVFADGGFTLSRPVTESFAIFSMHQSIADKKLKIGGFKDHPQYQSDMLGPAVINDLSAYTKRNIDFDIDDLPLGYDLGASSFTVTPRYKAGYRVNVGSGYSVILVAELLDRQGKKMGLQVGTASELAAPEKAPIQAFTNKTGRLVAQGLRPGQWILKFRDEKDHELLYDVAIPQDAQGVVHINTLSPSN